VIEEQEIRRGMEEAILEVQSADRLMVRVIEVLDRATSGLTVGASEQADVLTRTATTVETISKMIDKISANAEEASSASDQTRTEAVLGLDRVRSAIEGMDRLRVHVANNRRQIRRLGDRSVEIGSIVDLIANIAQRTELLALNATMESVRAGAEGRGFAAVAEEIRALAERAAAAGRDIGELVGAITSDMRESIRALDEEQAEVDRESTRVRDAGIALERISSFADRSADLVEGISQATHYQVEAAHDLVRAAQTISDIAHRAQEGAEYVEEFIEEVGLNGKRGRVSGNGSVTQPRAKALNGLARGAISVRLP
jgi:methyl-accepting chemotaxis protein